MITEVFVNGFRSLYSFNMKLYPGLNILVGPNGSGKTNIISFFQFLSNMVSRPISDAISLTGGAGAFFSKTGAQTFLREVECEIRGVLSVDEEIVYGIKGNFQYSYNFIVSSSKDFDSISLRHQRVKVRRFTERIRQRDLFWKNELEWTLSLAQQSDDSGKVSVSLEIFDAENVTVPSYIVGNPAREKNKTAKDIILERLDLEVNDTQCLVSVASTVIRDLRAVFNDLVGGDLLSIIPSEVKRAEYSSRQPGIHSDGSGLASTLFQLQRTDRGRPNRVQRLGSRNLRSLRGKTGKIVYQQIRDFTKIVNPAIKSIAVDNDPFDNVLKVKVSVVGLKEDLVLPFSSMSDGTVKWLALITAVLTYRSIFAIEEPENFLHPRMQQEIVKIMREDAQRRSELAFVIMTTHSETLLNAALPKEVIVVSIEKGETKANRPKNQNALLKEINNSGFGMGHFYITGALDNA